jgi:hypothetical protein
MAALTAQWRPIPGSDGGVKTEEASCFPGNKTF